MEDASVESAWNIRKLSSTLSWLTSESDIKSALISCVKRVLCYPLYRHWVLAMKVCKILYPFAISAISIPMEICCGVISMCVCSLLARTIEDLVH